MDSYMLATLLVTLLCFCIIHFTESAALNDYILDYQPLHFDQTSLHHKHTRVRRSLDKQLKFTFQAYNRTFKVQLEPSKSIFADSHELIFGSEPPQRVDTSFIFDGQLEGEPYSSVHLSILDGRVAGHIIVPGHTTYHIEPSSNHFQNAPFHSIIYPESHMNLDPYRHKREANGICGTDELYRQLRDRWQRVDDIQHKYKREASTYDGYYNMYTAEANKHYLRQKRQTQVISEKTTCFMSLRADNLLYKHMVDKYKDKAKDEILSLFGSHIKALNDIYPTVKFGNYVNIRFQLQRSTIMSECTTFDPKYCTDNLDVSNFLDLTSSEDHNSFCLVHTFTYRDFDGGTLGLAWVATADSRNSGVCGKFGPVRDSKNNISNRSLNTGIVTFINFKQEVPARVSQLTFAHEVGHNFGAQHDSTSQCAPYGTSEPNASGGNYIMYPSATQGNLPNNAKFSSCSITSITNVLATIEPNGKRVNCFQTSNNAFCGNGVMEGNETCDIGYVGDANMERCCVPQNETGNPQACNLTPTAQCSASQGPCCNSGSCNFHNSSVTCSAADDCRDVSFCNNTSAACPKPINRPNNTFCNRYTKVCNNGECISSICSNISWIECFTTQAQGSTDDQMCYISCKKNDTSECVSSNDNVKLALYPEFKNLLQYIHDQQQSTSSSLGQKRPAGSPCNDFKGYCDSLSKCRKVDAEGPFKQLTDLIFSPVTLGNIRTWIEDHWWAVLLMCVGIVVLMGVFIKVFAYNTPSKNPKKKTTRPQPSPPRGQQAARRPPQPKPKPDMQRSTVYATDLPMYSKPLSSREASSRAENSYSQPGRSSQNNPEYSEMDYGRRNGYDNHAFQGPSNHKSHQQYDRVAAPRKY